MKRSLFLFVILISVSEISAQWLEGYTYRKQITINESQIPDGIDFMDFPVLINIAFDSDLKDETNGGYVNNSNGWDLVFTTSDGTTLLDHDVEHYDETSGEFVAWVKIPKLDHDDNTVIYLYFGYDNPLSDPTKTTTWSNGFVSVYHLHDDYLDASGSNNGTNIGSVNAIGRVANGQEFENDNSTDRIEIGNFDVFNNSLTITAWIRPESFDNTEARIISKAISSAEQDHYWMMATIGDGTEFRFRLKTGGNTDTHFSGTGILSTGSWQYVAAVYNGNNMDLFYNGFQVGTPLAKTGSINTNSSIDVAIGNQPASVSDWATQKKPFDGIIDEVRIISAARSSDWLTAEYNNYNSPGTFYNLGQLEEDFSTFIVTNTDDSGEGSLRQAIINANANPGLDTINFSISGSGVHLIDIDDDLPVITGPVLIDGWSEPDFTNTPVVRIDGSDEGNTNGLRFSGTSDGSTVRGLMITRFHGNGIQIDSGANGITITGNWIGTTGNGSTALGNENNGINVQGANTIIGGIGANDRNVITNNGNEGINLTGSGATGTLIQGNYIGLNPDGSTGSGNSDVGIALLSGANNTTIGGNTAEERNIISMNYEGIEINSNNNTLQGNYIGTDVTGTLNRGNRSDDGIEIQSSAYGNLIGGRSAGQGNLIAYNALDGIYIANGTNNSILGNQIHSNNGLGIDLGTNGVTTNDSGDGDSGANNLQNYPILTSAVPSAGNIRITGSLNSTSNSSFRIEFFSSPAKDATGYGEGQRYLGYANLTTDGSGNATIDIVLTTTVAVGEFVSATATRCNTGFMLYLYSSEFSQSVTVGNVLTIDRVITNTTCNGGNDGEIDITVSGGTPGYSYSWSHGPTTEDVNGLIAGDYTVTVTDANLNSLDSTFTITEPDLLGGTINFTGVTCTGDADGTITISSPSGGSGTYEYSIIGGTWQSSGSFTNLLAGTYDVRVRDALANTCEVTLNATLDLTTQNDTIEPEIACLPDTIITVSDGIYEIDLSLAAPVVTDNCGIQSVTNDFSIAADAGGIYPLGTTTVTYTATDLSGNSSICSRQVTVISGDDELIIPQGFSPNNDGLNDTFEIIGIGAYPDNELFIYNVWGKEVYNMAGYDNSWDGTASVGVSAGQKLPTATYFYILNLTNEMVVKGFVYLIID